MAMLNHYWGAPELAAGEGPAFLASLLPAGRCLGRRLWLVIGPVYCINGIHPRLDGSCLVLVEAPAVSLLGRVNTVFLDWRGRRAARFTWVDEGGAPFAAGETTWSRLFRDGRLGPEVVAAGGRRLDGLPGWRGPHSFVPLFLIDCVRHEGRGWWAELDVDLFSQVRFTPADALFIRTTAAPLARLGGDDDGLCRAAAARLGLAPAPATAPLLECIRLHGENFNFLNNHQCYYARCFAGREVEYKLDLEPMVDIWGLTVHFYDLIRRGRLAGFRPEYRDEYQAWDYMNHLYEVTAPEEERGYVSFIPCTNGRYLIKRKHYRRDDLVRGERHEKDVAIDGPLDGYATRYGAALRGFPPFRRVRYDVNLESLASGHVYGVFFDHCSIEGSSAAPLMQCEVEYLRSRTVVPPDPDLALAELERLDAWTRGVLDGLKVRYRRGFYSKLSYLRDNCPPKR